MGVEGGSARARVGGSPAPGKLVMSTLILLGAIVVGVGMLRGEREVMVRGVWRSPREGDSGRLGTADGKGWKIASGAESPGVCAELLCRRVAQRFFAEMLRFDYTLRVAAVKVEELHPRAVSASRAS